MTGSAQTHLLADGRRLGYAEYGDPDGVPVFYFHGWISSRLDFEPNDALARKIGARVIAVDRPGFGLSDFQVGRRLLDGSDDMAQLADALHIERFAVLGWSGGGPTAAACAVMMPQRITRLGIIAGWAHIDMSIFKRGVPSFLTQIGLLVGTHRLLRSPVTRLMNVTVKYLPPIIFHLSTTLPLSNADRRVLNDPVIRRAFLMSAREGFRNGRQGVAWGMKITAEAWGFEMNDITVPTYVWHGDRDRIVPLAVSEHYHEVIADSQFTIYRHEGHLIFFSRIEDILLALI